MSDVIFLQGNGRPTHRMLVKAAPLKGKRESTTTQEEEGGAPFFRAVSPPLPSFGGAVFLPLPLWVVMLLSSPPSLGPWCVLLILWVVLLSSASSGWGGRCLLF